MVLEHRGCLRLADRRAALATIDYSPANVEASHHRACYSRVARSGVADQVSYSSAGIQGTVINVTVTRHTRAHPCYRISVTRGGRTQGLL